MEAGHVRMATIASLDRRWAQRVPQMSVNRRNTRMKQIAQVRWLLWVLIVLHHVSTAAGSRPNVIVILADDLGYGDTSLFDGWVKTPQIDRMASEGVTFTDFHSIAPSAARRERPS